MGFFRRSTSTAHQETELSSKEGVDRSTASSLLKSHIKPPGPLSKREKKKIKRAEIETMKRKNEERAARVQVLLAMRLANSATSSL